jgi:hypothetical protein
MDSDRLFAAGKSEGLAEGTELGRALGLAEGIERGNELLARENASLRATKEALPKRLCDTLEQSNRNGPDSTGLVRPGPARPGRVRLQGLQGGEEQRRRKALL